ncbi:MAG: type II toxin-antitoxin system HicB family antitoxin [Nitrospirae bacterium]|nr:type II toxin-antitoxin system HicB family antitoxin [Magnetococcales bacterium]
MRQAIVYPGDDGFWVSECPGLPGCVSQGESREEAIENIREAIDLYIEDLQDDNLPVP